MLILNAKDVRRALPMEAAIDAMKRAYAALSDGRAEVPLRAQLPIPPHEALGLFMPAYVNEDEGEGLAVKAVTVYPNNPKLGLPLIHAAVLVLDAATGRPQALLEGSTLTAIRTGAAAGAATDILARPDSHVAAIFGAGVQARTQLEAICTVRPIKTVWIYDPRADQVEAFIEEMAQQGPIPADLRKAGDPTQAVADADVICTATTSVTPVFADADLNPGTHLNGVGSYTPAMKEIPPETVLRALVVVDSREAAMEEAGDLIQPIKDGLITTDHIRAELGEIVLSRRSGRTSAEQITFFKSVGVAVQDVMAARLALKNARELTMGQQVEW
jgi:ornithine cyclodeaminase